MQNTFGMMNTTTIPSLLLDKTKGAVSIMISEYITHSMKQFFARPIWKKKDIIRHKETGKPMLVIHVFVDSCTLVTDLESKDPLSPILRILPRDYDQWAQDLDMQHSSARDEEPLNWDFDPLPAL